MTYDGTLHIAYDGTLHIAPGVQAPAEAVFEASTSAEVIRRWWQPEHDSEDGARRRTASGDGGVPRVRLGCSRHASASPSWVRPPTQATHPSGRITRR